MLALFSGVCIMVFSVFRVKRSCRFGQSGMLLEVYSLIEENISHHVTRRTTEVNLETECDCHIEVLLSSIEKKEV